MTNSGDLFPGFATRAVDTGDVTLFVRTGGSGPPLVLLHGYPETHACWHLLAPALARQFTLVLPDLRGYGRSSCPPSDGDHRAYSKRAMATDVARMMRILGFDRFAVMGHSRGARVGCRLALDRPELVSRLILLDIVSTWDQWQPAQKSAQPNHIRHWGFLAQPAPIPESLIGARPGEWLESQLKRGTRTQSLDAFDPRAMADYLTSHSEPDHIHAACEDYRASSTCDLDDEKADRASGRQIACPTLVFWGTHGSLSAVPDPLGLWLPWCKNVIGGPIESGHFIPEENPAMLELSTLPFLAGLER
jgi:haloacetate dehalogenase